MGSIWPDTSKHTIPIRARAYNDCVEQPVLLKTRSSGTPGGVPFERVFGAYRLARASGVTVYPGCPYIQCMCRNTHPKIGSF